MGKGRHQPGGIAPPVLHEAYSMQWHFPPPTGEFPRGQGRDDLAAAIEVEEMQGFSALVLFGSSGLERKDSGAVTRL